MTYVQYRSSVGAICAVVSICNTLSMYRSQHLTPDKRFFFCLRLEFTVVLYQVWLQEQYESCQGGGVPRSQAALPLLPAVRQQNLHLQGEGLHSLYQISLCLTEYQCYTKPCSLSRNHMALPLLCPMLLVSQLYIFK